jgi:quercetin dioxygenase-like cupin family protein
MERIRLARRNDERSARRRGASDLGVTMILDIGMAMSPDAGVIVPITDGEPIVRSEEREISILVAREELTIAYARYSADKRVAGPHVHHEHTDAFYVLEGELTFELGHEAETITVTAGGFVAVPPEVAHSFRTDGSRPAHWLTIHAHDGGFAAFMRGMRDGIEVDWDISLPNAEGGLSASEAIISSPPGGERLEFGTMTREPRCDYPRAASGSARR